MDGLTQLEFKQLRNEEMDLALLEVAQDKTPETLPGFSVFEDVADIKTVKQVKDKLKEEQLIYIWDDERHELFSKMTHMQVNPAAFITIITNSLDGKEWRTSIIGINKDFFKSAAKGDIELANKFINIAIHHECAEILDNFADLESELLTNPLSHDKARVEEFRFAFRSYGEKVTHSWFNVLIQVCPEIERSAIMQAYLNELNSFRKGQEGDVAEPKHKKVQSRPKTKEQPRVELTNRGQQSSKTIKAVNYDFLALNQITSLQMGELYRQFLEQRNYVDEETFDYQEQKNALLEAYRAGDIVARKLLKSLVRES